MSDKILKESVVEGHGFNTTIVTRRHKPWRTKQFSVHTIVREVIYEQPSLAGNPFAYHWGDAYFATSDHMRAHEEHRRLAALARMGLIHREIERRFIDIGDSAGSVKMTLSGEVVKLQPDGTLQLIGRSYPEGQSKP